MLWHKDSSAGTKGSDNGTESSFCLLPPKNPYIWTGTNGLGSLQALHDRSITETTAKTYALCTQFFLAHHLVEQWKIQPKPKGFIFFWCQLPQETYEMGCGHISCKLFIRSI